MLRRKAFLRQQTNQLGESIGLRPTILINAQIEGKIEGEASSPKSSWSRFNSSVLREESFRFADQASRLDQLAQETPMVIPGVPCTSEP